MTRTPSTPGKIQKNQNEALRAPHPQQGPAMRVSISNGLSNVSPHNGPHFNEKIVHELLLLPLLDHFPSQFQL